MCLFQDAKKDEAVRKAYKYLAALHEVRTITVLLLLFFSYFSFFLKNDVA